MNVEVQKCEVKKEKYLNNHEEFEYKRFANFRLDWTFHFCYGILIY